MAQKESKTKEKAIVTYHVSMDGHCCVNEITQGLIYEKGVKNVKCSYENMTVKITYRTDKTNKENLKKAIEKLGKKDVKELVADNPKDDHSKCNHNHKH